MTLEQWPTSHLARKRICPIHIMPDNFEGTQSLSQLSLWSLGQDQAVLTWLQQSASSSSMAKLKLVNMRTCEVSDVPIPVERIRFAVSYADGLDVVLHSKTYCSSPICKVSLNTRGQIVSEPTEISFKGQSSNNAFNPLGPVMDSSIGKGFYLANRFTGDRSRLFRVSADGTSSQVTTFSIEKPYGFSTTHGFLSLCDSFSDTIACRIYDADTLEWTMDRIVDFHDKGLTRWLQPYNLKDGAMLLVTGRASDEKAQRYEHFSVYRLEANGQKHRKRLEVENLNFDCESAWAMRVQVSEEQRDKICFYFSCAHRESDNNKFQFAYKCYPKVYFDAHVPLTNGCFVTSGDEDIIDFTIYA